MGSINTDIELLVLKRELVDEFNTALQQIRQLQIISQASKDFKNSYRADSILDKLKILGINTRKYTHRREIYLMRHDHKSLLTIIDGNKICGIVSFNNRHTEEVCSKIC